MECWINDCAFPRVEGSDYCAERHGGDVPERKPPARAPFRRGEASDEVFALLAADGPLMLGEIARRRGTSPTAAHKLCGTLLRHGRARRLSIGLYEAVVS